MKTIIRTILVVLLFIFGIFLVLAIGGGLLVLLAYGVGWFLNRIVHFDPFQVTVISLAGMIVFGILAERIWQAIISAPPLSPDSDEDEDEFDFEDDYFDEDEEDESVIYPGIPRWRQPLKRLIFPTSNLMTVVHAGVGANTRIVTAEKSHDNNDLLPLPEI